jgi:hypothetical protein
MTGRVHVYSDARNRAGPAASSPASWKPAATRVTPTVTLPAAGSSRETLARCNFPDARKDFLK